MHFKLTGSFVLALAFVSAAIPVALPDADADASTKFPLHHLWTPLTPENQMPLLVSMLQMT